MRTNWQGVFADINLYAGTGDAGIVRSLSWKLVVLLLTRPLSRIEMAARSRLKY